MKDEDKSEDRLKEEREAAPRRTVDGDDSASRPAQAGKAPGEGTETPNAGPEAVGVPDMDIDALELGALIDVPTLQALLDDFYTLTNMALAILDLKGRVLVAIGWQDICTRYHRVHPQATEACTESDLFLARNLRQGEFVAYKCKNQLWDVVTPLYVGGKHVGNIYTGQFFYDDETIDEEAFIAQADRYGFDRESYLSALKRVPRYSRDRVNILMHFLTKLAVFVSELSLNNLKLARAMSVQQRMAGALRASENLLRATFNATADGILVVDKEGRVAQSNPRFAALWRIPPDRRLDTRDDAKLIAFILDQVEDPEGFQSKVRELYLSSRESRDEIRFKDGRVYERFSCPVVSDGREVGRIWDYRDITARKRSERLLCESEERYRLITDNITDIIFTTDIAGHYTFISPSHKRVLARGGEVLGLSIFEHVHPEDMPGVRAAFDEAVRSRGVVRIEYRYRHPSRGYIWLEAEGRLVDMQGTLAGIIVARDITSRKLAEESLRESKERYRQLFQSMVSGFALHEIICDEQGRPRDYRFLEVNPAFEQLTGLKGEVVVGRTVREVMPAIEPYWIDLYGRVALTGNPTHFENYSGPLNKFFEVSAYSPQPGQFAAVFLDITERKRAEERLMNQMEFVATLLDTIPSPIYYKDVTGRYLGCNRAFEDFWGRPRESIIGKHVHDLGHAEITDQYADMDQKLFEQGGHQTYEWKGKAADGSEKDVIFNKAAFLDSSGNIAGLVGVIIDITERKKAEEERQRLHVQLSQAQKMESIGTLAGGIAHDFNNILSSVLGFAELAKLKAGAGEGIADELDEVLKAGIRARDLVKQILMFSRQADIKREPLDIVPLIKETMKFLRASLPTTIEFRQDLAVSGRLVMADPVQIHQILMNLGTNAAHAMQERGGLLEIRLDEQELDDPSELEYKGLQPGRYLRLSISDTGSGIPREIIHRIFDPFFTTKARGEGTGMGLSVVHGITKDMGGAVSVYSEPGRGTTFNVLLPIYEGGTVTTYAPHIRLKTGHGRILFVDDEEGVIVSGRGILEQLGYTITATTSPSEALALFTDAPDAYDLVLTDMTMPTMTGLELAEQIRKLRPAIPIVLCTGFSLGISPERIRNAGIREMVMKPMAASELSEAVYKAMHAVADRQ